ncbi:MAG: hypothetical protein FWF59_04175 [Turicibacter sp.]|nr:hypothetical protein [Turicibacter sp.]
MLGFVEERYHEINVRDLSDAQLAYFYKEGDSTTRDDIIACLFNKHRGLLIRHNYTRDWDNVAELGMFSIHKALLTYHPEKSSLLTYIMQIYQNEERMAMRKEKAKYRYAWIVSLEESVLENKDKERKLEDILPADNDGLNDYDHQLAIFYEKVNHMEMSSRDRTLISLMLEGKKQVEIGREMGLSQSMVSRYLQNIKKQLCEA